MKKITLGLLLSLLCLSGTSHAKITYSSIVTGYLSDDIVQKELAIEKAHDRYYKADLWDYIEVQILEGKDPSRTAKLLGLRDLVKEDYEAECAQRDVYDAHMATMAKAILVICGTVFIALPISALLLSDPEVQMAIRNTANKTQSALFTGLRTGTANLAAWCKKLPA